jgi:hypothetical protein
VAQYAALAAALAPHVDLFLAETLCTGAEAAAAAEATTGLGARQLGGGGSCAQAPSGAPPRCSCGRLDRSPAAERRLPAGGC